MPQRFQVLHCQFHTFGIVHTYLGDPGVGADVVIVENGRGFAGFKILHPGIQQGKTQQEAAAVVVLHHIGIVVDVQLELPCQGDQLYLIAGWLGCLTETHQKVIAEILRLAVIHVHNEHGQFGHIGAAGATGVAHLHCFFQNSLPHCLADVFRTAEGFGNGAFGNTQGTGNIIYGSQTLISLFWNPTQYILVS